MYSKLTPKQIDQHAFNQLISSYDPTTKFSDVLASSGYSASIENITLDMSANTSPIDFSGCQFNQVSIAGNLTHSLFDHSVFNKVIFKNADLSSSVFTDATFNQCTLTHSNFAKTSINNAVFTKNNIHDCDFSDSSFAYSSIDKSVFSKTKLVNTLDFENTLTDSHLIFNQKYHNDYVFKNAENHLIKPTIVTLDDPEWSPFHKLTKYGASVIGAGQYNASIDDSVLKTEVKKALEDIVSYGLKMEESIAEAVINSEQPTLKQIKAYAHEIMTNADALWIPGGPDIHPEFYNEANTDSYPSFSYYREIFEFSLAHAAIAMDKPILGICHGSQLMNVYLGGTLHQHVDTPSGYVVLTVHKKEGLIGSVIEDKSIGPSYHHQAVKKIADSLEVVATYDGVIKATQATDGKKIMLCQFHPEYEADISSKNIINQFVDLSCESKIKTKAIALSDVLEGNQKIVESKIVTHEINNEIDLPCAQAYHLNEQVLLLIETPFILM